MEIATIKAHLSILTVLEHYHLQPNKNMLLNCPFHEDKTPSLQIYPKTNTYCCFSSNCTAGTGDIIQFIELMDKQGKHAAIIKAQSLVNTAALEAAKPALTTNQPGVELSRTAVLTRFYQGTKEAIKRSPKAITYLKERSLDAEALGIGYVSEKSAQNWNDKLQQRAADIGILLPSANGVYTPRFKHCVIFPLKNSSGQVAGIYGRSIVNDAEQRHFYLPGKQQGLYPAYPKPATQKLILTESVIDAASLLGLPAITGEYSILALYGTNGFSEQHIEAIKSLKELTEVVFFLNGDDAGRMATTKHSETLHGLRPVLLISSVTVPEGEDINSLLQSHEPALMLHLLAARKALSFSSEQTTEKTAVPPIKTVPAKSKLNTNNPEVLTYTDNTLHITVLGGIKMHGLDRLRVTLKIETPVRKYPPIRHSLDLYNAEQVEKLMIKTGEQLHVSSKEVEHTFHTFIDEVESYRVSRMESLSYKPPVKPLLTQKEASAAMAYLKAPKLMERTLQDLGKTGIVGEYTNRAIMYMVFLSRFSKDPLHIMSLGASGSGKTYLQEKVSALVPSEDKLEITTLSENALYYFGEKELAHKLILIEDLDGAQEVLYPLRELQSKQKISKTVSLKDAKGNIKTVTFTVQGPVCVSGCTTREKLYEDNENRALLIYIDNSPEQDKRIMDYQRSLSAGETDRGAELDMRTLLQNVQRVLQSIRVVNPYAKRLVIPEQVFKKRRSNQLYLKFIETITLYHQMQRPKKADLFSEGSYIETTLEDIAWANKLLKEVLLSKSDELSGACRKFFESLKVHLKATSEERFYTKDIRKALRMNISNLKRYLTELTRNGYLTIRAGSRSKGFSYEVVSYEEYTALQSGINTVLDDLLLKLVEEEKIKQNGHVMTEQ